jgi:DNA-binding MarR family transcriptional regulator
VSANLALDLLRASDWLNDALLDRLHAAGWPPLNRSHALVFAHLGATAPATMHGAELARRMGVTRQSVHVLLRQMEDWELLSQRVDGGDHRRAVVVVAARGKRLLVAVRRELTRLEDELTDRIGTGHVDALRAALAIDWGPRP